MANETVAVTVRTPDDSIVAELIVSPAKPVRRLKTQIAGLEGIAVGNQALLLDGRTLEDNSTLADLGVFNSATLVLMRRTPLLMGRLTFADLQRILEDDTALAEAIDAYSEDPQYSHAEVRAIVNAVCETLLPGDDAAISESVFLEAIRKAATANSDGIAAPLQAQREYFTRSVKAALEILNRRLNECSAVEAGREVSDVQIADAGHLGAEEFTAMDAGREPPDMKIADEDLQWQGGADFLRPVRAPSPCCEDEDELLWKGAGQELRRHLQRRSLRGGGDESPVQILGGSG